MEYVEEITYWKIEAELLLFLSISTTLTLFFFACSDFSGIRQGTDVNYPVAWRFPHSHVFSVRGGGGRTEGAGEESVGRKCGSNPVVSC